MSAVISLILWQADLFFTSPTTIGFARWPLLHDVSRFVSVCNIDVSFLLPHFYFRSKPFSCLAPVPSPCTFASFIITSLFQHSLQNFIPLERPYSSLSFPVVSFLFLLSSTLYISGSFPVLVLFSWAYLFGLYFILTLSSQLSSLFLLCPLTELSFSATPVPTAKLVTPIVPSLNQETFSTTHILLKSDWLTWFIDWLNAFLNMETCQSSGQDCELWPNDTWYLIIRYYVNSIGRGASTLWKLGKHKKRKWC